MSRKKSKTVQRKENLVGAKPPMAASQNQTGVESDSTKRAMPEGEHFSRVIIEQVYPEIDGGLYPIKRTVGDKVRVKAILLADGHDRLKGNLLYRSTSQKEWTKTPLIADYNDCWWAEFSVGANEDYFYSIEAGIDSFATWAHDFSKRLAAHEVEPVHLEMGIQILSAWQDLLDSKDAEYINSQVKALRNLYKGAETEVDEFKEWLEQGDLQRISHSVIDTPNFTRYSKQLKVQVDPPYAGFSSWYEFFPRSFGENGKHGNFRTAVRMLDYIADLGFNIVYLPPIHPIGQAYRKGKNNALVAEENDVGSPWAIGSKDGGHKALHPDLGNFEDFSYFLTEARSRNLEIALDIAYQCSPDHPWVKEHPEWFKQRPDGSIQYAENPPKKYQDIYPIDFDSKDWKNLWSELKSVIDFWIAKGVKVFRVDNPHTKSFAFWKWALAEVRSTNPEVIFLSEAFTKPHVMAHLAKIGFHQSYTYFTWRNTKEELIEYLTELSQTEKAEYFRPNFWPNTPDILADAMQHSLRPHFKQRLILAATMSPNYGVYGPAYELIENIPREEGKEEYLDSEKYQLRHWNLNSEKSIAPLMKRLNQIRNSEKSLQNLKSIRFLETKNEHLIAFSKQAEDDPNDILIIVVNLDCHHTQIGQLELPREDFGIEEGSQYQAHDLLSDQRYLWTGAYQYIELNPHRMPGHIFKIRRKLRSEQDFDYYL